MNYNKIEKLLSSNEDSLKEYQQQKEKNENKDINLFSSISDVYKHENYTSDILRFILTPKAMGGNKIYLEKFLDFIEVEKDKIETFLSNIDEIEGCREKHRIDILIRNKKQKQAIIIESKLNDASDQPNQLVRYYGKVKNEDKLNVLKVVYLTLYPKEPDLEYKKDKNIDLDKYNELKEDVKKILCKVCVSCENEIEGFKTFQDYLKKEEVYDSDIVKQYSKLLNKIKGSISMDGETIIKNIFEDVKTIKEVNNLLEIFSVRGKYLRKIFNENFSEQYKNKNWNFDKDGSFYYSKNKSLYCFAGADDISLYVELGFYWEKVPKDKKVYQELLKNIAEDKDAEIDSNTYEIGYNGDKWYRLSYQFDESKMSFNEYYKIITKLLEKLKDKAQEKRIIS